MHVSPRRRSVLTLATALLAVPWTARAQPAARGPSPAHFSFRAIADDGSIVTDLKPGDLSLKVNGKPRTVQALTVYQSDAAAIAASVPLPPPYSTNVSGQGSRIIHVLVDDDSISPGRESQIKDAIRILSSELTPTDRLGILNTQGTLNITPTTDLTKVRLAASGIAGKGGASETDQDSRCRTKRVLAGVGTILSLSGAAPTTIVVFSSGLATPLVKKVTPGARGDAGTSDLCPVEPDDFTHLAAMASTANVDLYLFQVVDGLVAGGSVLDAGYESLAGVTAAQYTKMPADPQTAVSRLLRETSAYYIATFDPEPGERNGQAGRLELKTTRDKIKLRARPGVMLAKEAAAKTNVPRDMLRVGAEYRELPLRATSYASRLPTGTDVRVVALFEPLDGAPIAAASVGLFDAKGTLKAQWTAQQDDLARHPARADLQVAAGTYRVRVAVVDANGRAGTTDDEVKADMGRADPLALSTLVVGTQLPGGGFAPRLEFTSETVAIGLLEIYGVPKTGTVTVSLDVASTPDGQALANAETTVRRGSADDARTALGGFAIDRLPPGDYLMRAIVSLDGKPVGKAVRTLRKAR
jgi:hypothetical protein